jgi:adenosylmethionine-8-amino-7-oxononanoate aminotransferase
MWAALALGLSLKTSGASLVLSPPLVIAEADLARAVGIVIEAIQATGRAN